MRYLFLLGMALLAILAVLLGEDALQQYEDWRWERQNRTITVITEDASEILVRLDEMKDWQVGISPEGNMYFEGIDQNNREVSGWVVNVTVDQRINFDGGFIYPYHAEHPGLVNFADLGIENRGGHCKATHYAFTKEQINAEADLMGFFGSQDWDVPADFSTCLITVPNASESITLRLKEMGEPQRHTFSSIDEVITLTAREYLEKLDDNEVYYHAS